MFFRGGGYNLGAAISGVCTVLEYSLINKKTAMYILAY